ncbi:MAG TPA: hypothetical protein VN106_09410 [Sphingomicrobium sp.]|nr:hypothetical protein [Sphingomicrobium sp.]
MMFAVALGVGAMGTQAMAQEAQPAAPATQAAPAVSTAPDAPTHGRMQADRTRQQAQQMADSMFQRFDANHDGLLTRDEAEQALAQAAAARGDSGNGGARAQRMLDRMLGGAVSVTLAQFESQALTRFDREDLNHDGVVTSAERRQGWASRGQ